MRRLKPYIYQKEAWPQFSWDEKAVLENLANVRNLQGRVMGRMEAIGFDLREEKTVYSLSEDVLKSSEIEGEFLHLEEIRSSVCRKLGVKDESPACSTRHVDGFVEMMLDVTKNHHKRLTKSRLFTWHKSLFPDGKSGVYKIKAGCWREDSTGPMQVVSGALGKEKVHFEAPPSSELDKQMQQFFDWFNADQKTDFVLKSAVAHLWFLTIHPFEDGNGRIARALSDMLLARADKNRQKFYSLSAQIRVERKEYYLALEKSQQGTLDITNWMLWFLHCLENALNKTEEDVSRTLFKHNFWLMFSNVRFNKRQQYMLNKLLTDFEGKLNTSKWAKMNKCSTDTALRDVQELLKLGVLLKEREGGRSTNYTLVKQV
jgi:Fic family protein